MEKSIVACYDRAFSVSFVCVKPSIPCILFSVKPWGMQVAPVCLPAAENSKEEQS